MYLLDRFYVNTWLYCNVDFSKIESVFKMALMYTPTTDYSKWWKKCEQFVKTPVFSDYQSTKSGCLNEMHIPSYIPPEKDVHQDFLHAAYSL